MVTIEYIILVIAAILAILFIVRTIVKIAKGESPCMFCKTCGDDEEASCCADKTEEAPCCADKTEEAPKEEKKEV
jgi:hypothetical protein